MKIFLIVVIGVLGFFIVILAVYAGGNWLLWRLKKPKPPSEESIRRYRERLLNPRWAEIEELTGATVPECIKQLYMQTELICQREICFSQKEGKTYDVAEFLPADTQSLNERWDAVKQSEGFPFATDYFGDTYYVSLGRAESEACPVMYYHHDGNDFEFVSGSLDEFLGWYQKSG